MMSPWCNNVQISCCFSISASLPYRQYRGLRIWVLGPGCNTGMRQTRTFKLNCCLSMIWCKLVNFCSNRCNVSVENWHCERVCEYVCVYFLHVWNEPLPSDCFQNKSKFSIKPEDIANREHFQHLKEQFTQTAAHRDLASHRGSIDTKRAQRATSRGRDILQCVLQFCCDHLLIKLI